MRERGILLAEGRAVKRDAMGGEAGDDVIHGGSGAVAAGGRELDVAEGGFDARGSAGDEQAGGFFGDVAESVDGAARGGDEGAGFGNEDGAIEREFKAAGEDVEEFILLLVRMERRAVAW